MLGHGDQLRRGIFVQEQHWHRLIPAERRALHAAALGANHSIQAEPDLIAALGSDQQHAALTLDRMAEPWLAGDNGARQIKHDEGLAGAPLATQQSVSAGWDQVLNRPAFQWSLIKIAVGIERRQVGALGLLVKLRILIEQLRILWPLQPLPWRSKIVGGNTTISAGGAIPAAVPGNSVGLAIKLRLQRLRPPSVDV